MSDVIKNFSSKQAVGYNTQNKTQPPDVAASLMQKVREDVARLLNHAVKQPDITIKTEFLQKIVPLLCRDIKDLTLLDHVELWGAYNHLSTILSPVTDESLEVNKGLNDKNKNGKSSLWGLVGWMIVFVFGVFLTQGYSINLSNNLNKLATLSTDYSKILEEESLARKASDDQKGVDSKEPLLSIISKKNILFEQLNLFAKKQQALNNKLSLPWTSGTSDLDINSDANGSRLSRINAILHEGKSIELILNSLILPLLLGFLGAIAFLVRNILNHLSSYTFIPSWSGRDAMRVLLGGLLGVIGPWLYVSGNVDEVGLGLLLFSFLLGYSVELAFSLFDKFITHAREAIKPGGDKNRTEVLTNSAIASVPGTVTEDPISGTVVGDAVVVEQNYQRYKSQLQEIIALESVLATVTPPDFYAQACAPKIQMAKDLLQQLDAARERALSDATALSKAVTAVAELSKAITQKNHPLAIVLCSAIHSFEAVSAEGAAVTASREAEALVMTLFAGAAAAFSKSTSTYERWLAYVWAQPFAAKLLSDINLSKQNAEECLKLTQLFQQVFRGQVDTLPSKLVELAVSTESTEQLAERLWQTPTELGSITGDLPAMFGTVEVFAEGWQEYRHCLVRYVLQTVDFPENRFSTDTLLLPVTDTLAAIDVLRQNTISEKDLDILCYLSQELMKQAQSSASLDVVALIKRTLIGGAS